jgi:hypothetical protein
MNGKRDSFPKWEGVSICIHFVKADVFNRSARLASADKKGHDDLTAAHAGRSPCMGTGTTLEKYMGCD